MGTMRWVTTGTLATLALVVLQASFGCGGSEASASAKGKVPDGARSRVIEHEPCEEKGNKVDAVDANNDGKPDIRRVFAGGREICRVADLNHDGKPDMYEYFDAAGQLRRRESDYDDNGVVNAVEHFEGGKLARRELDTMNQGAIDTWDFFDVATGARTKRERDLTGDGRIDQWWSYETDRVTIVMDKNGDGVPEPESTIVLGPNGAVLAMAQDGGLASFGASDAGVGDASAAAMAPPPPPPAAPESPRLDVPDAGEPGKPKRGGAKR